MKYSVAILLLVFFSTFLSAQEPSGIKKILYNYGIRKDIAMQEGKFWITPFVGPAYTPELGFLLAGGGILTFKTSRSDSRIQRSSIPFSVGISSTGAVVLSFLPATFWVKDKLRITGDIYYKDMPDNYWGVGYETANTTPKSDSTTAYGRQWWWVSPKIAWQFQKNFFLGINVDFNHTLAYDINLYMASDPYIKEFGIDCYNAGLGIILRHDSRDIPVNAWKGVYIDVMATFYGQYLGGNYNYQIVQIDLRDYEQLFRKGSVLAFQFKSRFGLGDVPWSEMSQIGTPFDLRGYTWGHYRDRSLIIFLAEYRHTFLKRKTDELSNSGLVTWVGTGSVAPNLNDFNHWLPNFGVGYRLQVQPRMNVRLDFGYGREGVGIYFNFTEAF